MTTLAGLAGTSGSADGVGSDARFNSPSGLACYGNDVYVADTMNNTIRMNTPDGVVSTFAGKAGVAGYVDGDRDSARFFGPQGLAWVPGWGGGLYIADTNNQVIRQYNTMDEVVETLAGQAGTRGSADGVGSSALFNFPSGVAVDAAGNTFVADMENHTIRVISIWGDVRTLAGEVGAAGAADGVGAAARFNSPAAVATDGAGSVYVADADNDTIRGITVSVTSGFGYFTHIAATGTVSTLAGSTGESGSADGVGDAARFDHPTGVAVDPQGTVYISDTNNGTLRMGRLPNVLGIWRQPVGYAVGSGDNCQFSVTAYGTPPLSYQWYFNKHPIIGATGSTYGITNIQPSQQGDYTVTVSNSAGSVTSIVAPLTVYTGTPAADSSTSGGAGTRMSAQGGGGGATEPWFAGLLSLLACLRARRRLGR